MRGESKSKPGTEIIKSKILLDGGIPRGNMLMILHFTKHQFRRTHSSSDIRMPLMLLMETSFVYGAIIYYNQCILDD